MTAWTIRRATAADADALARCIERAYAVYDGRDLDLPPVAEGIAEQIAAHHVWVAEAEDAIAGGLILIVGDGAMGERSAQLANVAVDPDFTGRGLGRALMAAAEDEARRLGVTELHLTTHADLPENIRLYTRLGWRETTREDFRVHMAKRI